MKRFFFVFIIFKSLLSHSQTFHAADCRVTPFDKSSDVKLFSTNNGNFDFYYSDYLQRFFIDFSINLKPNKYYKIIFNTLNIKGKQPPIAFIRFESNKKNIKQIFFHVHSNFYTFKTPEDFDRIRLIIQYQNSELSFNSFTIDEYSGKSNIVADFTDIKNLLYDDDFSNYNKNRFLDKVFDSIFVSKWNLGNYYNENFWIGNSHTRTQERWIYSFFWLQDLVLGFENTGDLKYLFKGKEILEIYFNTTRKCYSEFKLKGKILKYSNSDSSIINKPMIWHDETVARRLFSLMYFYNYSDSINDPKFKMNLEYEMTKIASVLATDEFYSQDNNHGMFQSLSLLAYSCSKSDSLAAIYQDIAISRLFDYFLFTFTDEGVSREHTPTYHYTISNRLGAFLDFYEKYFTQSEIFLNIYPKLKKVFDSSKVYSYAILMPSGHFPPIGDCIKGYKPQQFYPKIFDIDTLKVLKQNDYVFKNSGYAVFRESWNNKNSYYLLFLAAYNHWSHKHSDDLSFILYYNGIDIFIDNGYFGYEHNNFLVDYGNSSFAHNTLIVDDKNLTNKASQDKKYTSVGISDYRINKNIKSVSGFNKRWKNVEHFRKITQSNNSTIISDSIISIDSAEHNFKLLFHLNKDIIPYLKDKSIILKFKGVDIAEMIFLPEAKISIYYGDNNGNDKYLGYHCESEADFTNPTFHYVICIENSAITWSPITKINFYKKSRWLLKD